MKKPAKDNKPDMSCCPVCGDDLEIESRNKDTLFYRYRCRSVFRVISDEAKQLQKSVPCLERALASKETDQNIDDDLIEATKSDIAQLVHFAFLWSDFVKKFYAADSKVVEAAIEYLDENQAVPRKSEKSEAEWELMDKSERVQQWMRDLYLECGIDPQDKGTLETAMQAQLKRLGGNLLENLQKS